MMEAPTWNTAELLACKTPEELKQLMKDAYAQLSAEERGETVQITTSNDVLPYPHTTAFIRDTFCTPASTLDPRLAEITTGHAFGALNEKLDMVIEDRRNGKPQLSTQQESSVRDLVREYKRRHDLPSIKSVAKKLHVGFDLLKAMMRGDKVRYAEETYQKVIAALRK